MTAVHLRPKDDELLRHIASNMMHTTKANAVGVLLRKYIEDASSQERTSSLVDSLPERFTIMRGDRCVLIIIATKTQDQVNGIEMLLVEIAKEVEEWIQKTRSK